MLHTSAMSKQSGARLAKAISALVAHFKVGPEGAGYADLSLTDAAVIASIADAAAGGREPIQKEVGDSLGLPKTTMTSAVKRLRARGLVEQVSGTSDARARTLRLTAIGHQAVSRLRQAQIAASVAILQTLPQRDQGRLVELLETVAANLPPKTARDRK